MSRHAHADWEWTPLEDDEREELVLLHAPRIERTVAVCDECHEVFPCRVFRLLAVTAK